MKNIIMILAIISAGMAANCQKVQTDTATTKAKVICPKCGEVDCIYQEINDNVKGEGTDQEIYNSVLEVCRKRKITNQATIELILKEYYL